MPVPSRRPFCLIDYSAASLIPGQADHDEYNRASAGRGVTHPCSIASFMVPKQFAIPRLSKHPPFLPFRFFFQLLQLHFHLLHALFIGVIPDVGNELNDQGCYVLVGR